MQTLARLATIAVMLNVVEIAAQDHAKPELPPLSLSQLGDPAAAHSAVGDVQQALNDMGVHLLAALAGTKEIVATLAGQEEGTHAVPYRHLHIQQMADEGESLSAAIDAAQL
mmetsp:Transcript_59428/g.109969  ORF Transcript_59428/g.109969 Transcript_59428/m.109969 type:complete len:112 (-) Transcript_59428:143-478(-)